MIQFCPHLCTRLFYTVFCRILYTYYPRMEVLWFYKLLQHLKSSLRDQIMATYSRLALNSVVCPSVRMFVWVMSVLNFEDCQKLWKLWQVRWSGQWIKSVRRHAHNTTYNKNTSVFKSKNICVWFYIEIHTVIYPIENSYLIKYLPALIYQSEDVDNTYSFLHELFFNIVETVHKNPEQYIAVTLYSLSRQLINKLSYAQWTDYSLDCFEQFPHFWWDLNCHLHWNVNHTLNHQHVIICGSQAWSHESRSQLKYAKSIPVVYVRCQSIMPIKSSNTLAS